MFGTEILNVCNKGDLEVFYASLGVRESFLSTRAVIQGMFSIDPGHCRNVLPGGMSDVTVAFFYSDRSGTFGNGIFKVEGEKGSLFSPKYSQICVHPEGFREDTAGEHLGLSQFITIWTPPCRHGYFPAKTSFGVWGERDYIFTIDIAPPQKTLITPFPPLPENGSKAIEDVTHTTR